MPTYTLAPYAFEQFFDDSGNPLSGGFVYTYASGTSTPATTYHDSVGTPNANPVVLDSAGRAVIYLAPTSYKFILKNSVGVQIGPTMDPVTAVGAGSSGLGAVFVFGGQSSAPITATSYVSGATFDKLHPGTAVFFEDSANLQGTYELYATGMVTPPGGNTLTVSLMNLSDGAPDTPIAQAPIIDAAGQVGRSAPIVFGAPGTNKFYGIKCIVDSGSAFAWGIMLVRIS